MKKLVRLAEQRLEALKNGTESLIDEAEFWLRLGDDYYARELCLSAAEAYVKTLRNPKGNGAKATR